MRSSMSGSMPTPSFPSASPLSLSRMRSYFRFPDSGMAYSIVTGVGGGNGSALQLGGHFRGKVHFLALDALAHLIADTAQTLGAGRGAQLADSLVRILA